MNRKETTKLITDTLIRDRLSDRKYYAREVSIDANTSDVKRVDVMEFKPRGVIYASDIEKGIFICYEIKSCIEDVYSGNGLNFFGEENYIVTTMEVYKKLTDDIRERKLDNYIKEHYPESSLNYGVIVLVPSNIDLRSTDEKYAEFESPTSLDADISWKTYTIYPCSEGHRTRSTTELLFCMLRSKHSYTNQEQT